MKTCGYPEKLNAFAKNIQNKFRDSLLLYKLELSVLGIAALLVYLPFMVDQLNNADDFMMGVNYHPQSYDWKNAQGRFLLRWLDEWRGGLVFPTLTVGLSIIMLLLIAVLLWEIFECVYRVERILIGCFILFSSFYREHSNVLLLCRFLYARIPFCGIGCGFANKRKKMVFRCVRSCSVVFLPRNLSDIHCYGDYYLRDVGDIGNTWR